MEPFTPRFMPQFSTGDPVLIHYRPVNDLARQATGRSGLVLYYVQPDVIRVRLTRPIGDAQFADVPVSSITSLRLVTRAWAEDNPYQRPID